ncbi:MAG: Usg family protein [Candidatus Pacebacteria bacterium]|nr:Usg family protein [Candidatus Paceibacterota bacterium]
MILLKRKILVTLNILYWMPDCEHILQQFVWQTTDVGPEYPRVHKFLNYWNDNIDAVISEVNIADSCETKYRSVREIINY